MTDDTTKSPRGFAAMTPEKRREIARKGGCSVPAQSRSFSQNRDLARESGRLGGMAVAPENRSFARDPEKAKVAGRIGGKASVAMRHSAKAP